MPETLAEYALTDIILFHPRRKRVEIGEGERSVLATPGSVDEIRILIVQARPAMDLSLRACDLRHQPTSTR